MENFLLGRHAWCAVNYHFTKLFLIRQFGPLLQKNILKHNENVMRFETQGNKLQRSTGR
jgi:hypothetical protein